MIAERIEAVNRVDWWPFTRLVITAVALGLAAHVFLGWKVPIREVMALPGQMLGVLSILAMISFILADLYLLLFLVPLYALGVLNHWFYSGGRWGGRVVLGLRSEGGLAIAGLCGEVVMFGGFALLVRRLLALL